MEGSIIYRNDENRLKTTLVRPDGQLRFSLRNLAHLATGVAVSLLNKLTANKAKYPGGGSIPEHSTEQAASGVHKNWGKKERDS